MYIRRTHIQYLIFNSSQQPRKTGLCIFIWHLRKLSQSTKSWVLKGHGPCLGRGKSQEAPKSKEIKAGRTPTLLQGLLSYLSQDRRQFC